MWIHEKIPVSNFTQKRCKILPKKQPIPLKTPTSFREVMGVVRCKTEVQGGLDFLKANVYKQWV